MKFLLYLSIFLFSFTSSFAHNTYFSFAEMGWNSSTDRIELTIDIETHDFEHYLEKKGIVLPSGIENSFTDSMILEKIKIIVINGFNLNVNGIQANLTVDGFEILKTGHIMFYLSAGNVTEPKKIDVKFDLFMDYYKSQQNKLTYLNNQKQSLTFTASRKNGTLSII